MIDIQELTPGQAKAALAFLERDPVRNLRIIWAMRRWGLFNLGLPEQGRFLVGYEKDSIQGLLFLNNMGLWRLDATGDTILELAQKAISLWGAPEVLAGPEDDVEELLDQMPVLDEKVEHKELELSLLLGVEDFKQRRGDAVPARFEDLDDLVMLEEMMQWELLGGCTARWVTHAQMDRAVEEGAALVRCDRQAVAKAEIEASTAEVDELGGVYTLFPHRRNGHASSACTLVCGISLDRGKKVRLETQRDNHAAIAFYKRLGFRELWPHLAVRFKTAGP